ncbi:hypothetical protein PR048_019294 [Dryococelus australis]|uniref:Peptidase aspartic putative domain-containing protein n=1 Tax=Dryococelus australis TaxID=614101 RepID=A0ABQ9H370_9NEOP|nr:hypothetical protein PR048_019294 [Dryococelus australis]
MTNSFDTLETRSLEAPFTSEVGRPLTTNPDCVGILVGAEFVKGPLPPGNLVALDSVFGWILMGTINNTESFGEGTTFFDGTLGAAVEHLCILEELSDAKAACTPEENAFENISVETHVRLETGRYMNALPFKTTDPPMGESHDLTLCLLSLEHLFK